MGHRIVMSTTTDGGEDFARLAEPFRRELVAYGYRMLGSVDDAEEVVQDVYLDAWRAYEGFEGRSSQAPTAARGPICAGRRPHHAPSSRRSRADLVAARPRFVAGGNDQRPGHGSDCA